ncbi:MAG: hypothetical protein K0B01_03420 [Syntrophobacterales bacterium]|nr:hypothetical protein [Syntrophobacterales bacterium]
MKWNKMAALILGMLFTATTTAVAGDFDWFRDLNIQAQADSSGFRARLATRFQIGDAQISAVLGNIADPADAYMVFRLGELSHNPPERVVDVYKVNKEKGWGVIARQLGIKPGSAEFHALKQGHDLDRGSDRGKKDSQGKNKVNDRNKGKGKNK